MDLAHFIEKQRALVDRSETAHTILDGAREGPAIADPKHEALHVFTRAVVQQRGMVSRRELETILTRRLYQAARA
ncbi:MAG: hypothetical protein ACI89X_004837 [Planctomycetota bacterium]